MAGCGPTERDSPEPGSTESDAPPAKRSLVLRGHRTSVSMEDEFWEAFRALAAAEGRSLNDLAAEIDAGRGPRRGLASAIRVHVLRHAQGRR